MYFRSAKTVASTGTATLNDVLGFTTVKVLYREYDSGNIRDVTESWLQHGCETMFYDSSTFGTSLNITNLSNQSCFFASKFARKNILNTTSTICVNTVETVEYTLYHSAEAFGTINNATVSFIITDMAYNTKRNPQEILLSQSFGISFQSQNKNGLSNTNGNLVKR